MAPEGDYYPWRDAASDAGLAYFAATEYYKQRGWYAYEYTVDGASYEVPVITLDSWLGPFDDDVQPFLWPDDNAFFYKDESALAEYARPIAYDQGDDITNPDPDEYFWNGETLAVTWLSPDSPEFAVRPSDFYSTATLHARFQETLYRELYEQGIAPDADAEAIREAMADVSLPFRDAHAATLPAITRCDVPFSTGAGALTVFNTGDGYRAIVAQRGDHTPDLPGWWELRPAGYLEPDDEADGDLFSRLIRKEYAEEVFGFDEDAATLSAPCVTELDDLLAADESRIEYTVASFNPATMHLDVFGLLLIDDPSYYHDFVAGEDLGNWEGDTTRMVDITDEDDLRWLLEEADVLPQHTPAIIEGLLRAKDLGIDIPLEVTRSRP